MILKIGEVFIDTNDIIGYAHIGDAATAKKYNLLPGLYPIIYFEEKSVQISAYEKGDPDLLWIQREDFNWVKING